MTLVQYAYKYTNNNTFMHQRRMCAELLNRRDKVVVKNIWKSTSKGSEGYKALVTFSIWK